MTTNKCAVAVAVLGTIQLVAAGSSGDSDGRFGGSSHNKGDMQIIGDMQRSDSSTSRFFRSIDSDGDGILEKPEMESFVRETIGGSAFDTSAEVEAGVDQVLEQLDRDHDDGLDRDDVLAHWMQLESLLTAEEVSEWVVHAVQLPNEIGGIFLDHLVTGYDFPELVDHGGEAIESELGITKASHRKKIMRHINARMLGIGTVPTTPSQFRHTLESCSTVSLSWSKSTAKGFPVHSYRVQRRAVPLRASSSSIASPANNAAASASNIDSLARMGNKEKFTDQVLTCDAAIDASREYFPTCENDSEVSFGEEYAVVCAGPDTSKVHVTPTAAIVDSKLSTSIVSAAAPTTTHSSWVTVYRGSDNEFVDSNLEDAHTYVYRVQAWNSVGRSDWTTVDIGRSLKKQGCTNRSPGAGSKPYDGVLASSRGYGHDEGSGWTFLQTIYFVFDFISTFVRALFALAAIGAATMRFKRANALSSTSTNVEVVFPWLWRGMNKVSNKLFGIDMIPKAMLGDKRSKRVSESAYDKEVKSVGLAGYKARSSFTSPDEDRRISNDRGRPNRRAVFALRRSVSASQITSTLDQVREDELLGGGFRTSNGIAGRRDGNEPPSSGNICSQGADTAGGSNSSVGHASPSSKRSKNLLPKTFFGRSKSAGTGSTDGSASTGSSGKTDGDSRQTMRSMPANISTSRRSLMTEMSTIDEDGATIRTNSSSARDVMHDDYNRCNCCHKEYKFPHRFRHHCARCLSTFCHKHGKTTHSNLISCKVPSDCICNVCLEANGYSSRSSSRNGSSNGGSKR